MFFLGLSILTTSCSNQSNNTPSDSAEIIIGHKPFTEQYILSNVLKLLIEEKTGIKVSLKEMVDTQALHPAIINGDIDLYPEYTGTVWKVVLNKDSTPDEKLMLKVLKDYYLKNFNLKVFNPYGLNNTYTLAMKDSLASSLNITTYSDLAKESQNLIFGAEIEFFERSDGFYNLAKTYNMKFKEVKEFQVYEKYDLISKDYVQVIDAFATDGYIEENNLRILIDDKSFFPPYYCTTIAKTESLEKYPKLKEALLLLENNISNQDMIYMNFQVENKELSPRDVARNFLLSKGLI